ncbi:MAG: bifunctional methylenetetrahydrofolate dehydrogenase/methenyltetrahydrofolate cyclohydrolase FolD [Alphaproteobacteria bacterium]|nr:bifunctional methylenetetrahydrofolate dehydrogenase/methenyltetrahydrofolate cyclohydrolase FolD [Alphaproteobacteria bacterium]
MAQAHIIDGKAIAAELCQSVAAAAARLRETHGLVPGLATIMVGDDPASHSYVRAKGTACANAGLVRFEHRLPSDISEAALIAEIARLNADERIDGILVQLPLPAQIDTHRVITAIDPAKDVDGFHPINVGRLWTGTWGLVPCTPQGCLILLRSVRPDLAGAEAVVLGRSNIVGKPMAALLLAADCTITSIHSKTRDAPMIVWRADIVVVAVGRPLLVRGDWIKPGAIVIDCGINAVSTPDGRSRIVGDVDFAAVQRVAGAVTPVPGGVGPMTIACLLRNTLAAACRRRGLADPLPL